MNKMLKEIIFLVIVYAFNTSTVAHGRGSCPRATPPPRKKVTSLCLGQDFVGSIHYPPPPGFPWYATVNQSTGAYGVKCIGTRTL